MNLRGTALICCMAMLIAPAQASWLYCKFKPSDCTYIQGTLMSFATADAIIEDCRALTRGNIGARAMNMSVHSIFAESKGKSSHPLLAAYLAYDSLHDSPLKFDRRVPIENRYPYVRQACGQAFADWNE